MADLIIEENEEQQEALDIPERNRNIITEQGDPEIDSLYKKWKRGKLDIQPDFQRGFV
jgi:hypothetical protein